MFTLRNESQKRGMTEETAAIQDIKTKRDLLLDTLVPKGCKGRGCAKTEVRSTNNQLGTRDFLTQLSAHQSAVCSWMPTDFWRQSCLLDSTPSLARQRGGGSLTVWQFACGATITLQTGEERQAGEEQRHSKGCSVLNRKGFLQHA